MPSAVADSVEEAVDLNPLPLRRRGLAHTTRPCVPLGVLRHVEQPDPPRPGAHCLGAVSFEVSGSSTSCISTCPRSGTQRAREAGREFVAERKAQQRREEAQAAAPSLAQQRHMHRVVAECNSSSSASCWVDSALALLRSAEAAADSMAFMASSVLVLVVAAVHQHHQQHKKQLQQEQHGEHQRQLQQSDSMKRRSSTAAPGMQVPWVLLLLELAPWTWLPAVTARLFMHGAPQPPCMPVTLALRTLRACSMHASDRRLIADMHMVACSHHPAGLQLFYRTRNESIAGIPLSLPLEQQAQLRRCMLMHDLLCLAALSTPRGLYLLGEKRAVLLRPLFAAAVLMSLAVELLYRWATPAPWQLHGSCMVAAW